MKHTLLLLLARRLAIKPAAHGQWKPPARHLLGRGVLQAKERAGEFRLEYHSPAARKAFLRRRFSPPPA